MSTKLPIVINMLQTVLLIPDGPDGSIRLQPDGDEGSQAPVSKINEALVTAEKNDQIEIKYPTKKRRQRTGGTAPRDETVGSVSDVTKASETNATTETATTDEGNAATE